MAVLGANPVELRGLAGAMRFSSEHLSGAGGRLSSRIRACDWHGADARAFGSSWPTHARRISAAAEALALAADALERNAFEQESASGAGVRDVVPGASMRKPAAGLPLRTETYWINGSFAALFGVHGEARLTIEHLRDGTAIVWLEQVSSVSAAGGVGVRLGSEEVAIGAEASAHGGILEGARTGWRMEGSEVHRFAARAAASEALERATGDALLADDLTLADLPLVGDLLPSRVARMEVERLLNPVGTALVDWFESTALDTGEPHYSEKMFGLELGAGAGVDLGVALGGIGAMGGLATGIRTSPDGRSFVVRGAVATDAGVAGRGHSVAATREIEMPLGRNGPSTLQLTTEVREGDGHSLRIENYEIPEAARHEVIEAVANGDLDGAGGRIVQIAGSLEAPVSSSAVEGTVLRDAIDDIGGEVAMGPKGEVRLGGGREVVEFGAVEFGAGGVSR